MEGRWGGRKEQEGGGTGQSLSMGCRLRNKGESEEGLLPCSQSCSRSFAFSNNLRYPWTVEGKDKNCSDRDILFFLSQIYSLD